MDRIWQWLGIGSAKYSWAMYIVAGAVSLPSYIFGINTGLVIAGTIGGAVKSNSP
jgi:hypothetical protein